VVRDTRYARAQLLKRVLMIGVTKYGEKSRFFKLNLDYRRV